MVLTLLTIRPLCSWILGRCCINIVNSLNLLHFQVCDEKRKLLNLLEFSGIMQQRRIMDELHLKTNAHLVQFAIKQGLVSQT